MSGSFKEEMESNYRILFVYFIISSVSHGRVAPMLFSFFLLIEFTSACHASQRGLLFVCGDFVLAAPWAD